MSKIGIDISTYQKNINYDEACKHIDFCIIRVGYGVSYLPDSQRDKEFDNHYNGFKGKLPLGAYYYAYGTDYDTGRKEAENCLSYMGDKQFEMPIYYDMEENRNTKEAGQGFVDRIREAGLKAGIYASSSFYRSKDLDSINCDSVWIAQYGSNNGNIPTSKPTIPFDLWQYTSKGYVEGIGSNIDMDIMEKDVPTSQPNNNSSESSYSYKQFVKDIQIAEGQTGKWIDGIAGNRTLELTPTISRYKNDRNACVKPVQKYLYYLGYKDVGRADGIAGVKFDTAVKQFQRDNGCVVDGELTSKKKTWKKLLKIN